MTRLTRFLVMGLSVMVLGAPAANAQERGMPRERERERPAERARFHSPHWVLDGRFHHDHYYPAVGYVVATLPGGYVSIPFAGVPYSFQAGVWFRPTRGGFVVVTPPVGIVVPVLPPASSALWIAGAPYWYANDVFYAPAPSGGYMVVSPPPGVETATVQPPGAPPVTPPPPTASAPTPAAPATAYWYYCSSTKAYYPSSPTCPEPWITVPARPQ